MITSRPHTRRSRAIPAAAFALLAALSALTVATPVCRADDDRDQDRARAALQSGEVRPLSEVLALAETQFEGQMVEVELEKDDGQWLYELKLLTPGGSLLKLYYDARDRRLVDARGHHLLAWWRGQPEALPPHLRERWDRHQARGDGERGPPPGHRRGWFSRWWDDGDGPPPPGSGPGIGPRP